MYDTKLIGRLVVGVLICGAAFAVYRYICCPKKNNNVVVQILGPAGLNNSHGPK